MQQLPVYALDFDGVLCDSALETGIVGWRAAVQIWSDMPSEPASNFTVQFAHTRPVLETGYEAIIMARLLFEGITPDAIVHDFATQKTALVTRYGLQIATLKKLFSDNRDTWIAHDIASWLTLNPLFPGITQKLATLNTRSAAWYIVTTKQERFVHQILQAQQLSIPASSIYGLDCQLSKEDVLLRLTQVHPNIPIIFVEDRLLTLLSVQAHPRLPQVKLQLAEWGYNTAQERIAAMQAGIAVITKAQFLA